MICLSVEMPPRGVRVEIVDDDGKVFLEGVVGDAWLQDEGIRRGWYLSGDFGGLDVNGCL